MTEQEILSMTGFTQAELLQCKAGWYHDAFNRPVERSRLTRGTQLGLHYYAIDYFGSVSQWHSEETVKRGW